MQSFGRLLDLLALLQSAPSATGAELAERLGVTLRTVRRDVGRLRDAGFQIEANPGVYGGYHLVSRAQLHPLVLTDDEAIAVAIGLRGTALATVNGINDAATLDVLAKLERLLPPRLRARVADLREASVSMLRTPPVPSDATTLTVLARACRESLRVTFTYTSGAGNTATKQVEPYRLVQTSHCWYLAARPAEGNWRTFRVDRISDLQLTPWHFQCEEPPDVERLMTESMAVAPYPFVARLRLPVSEQDARTAVPRSYGLVEAVDDTTSELTVGFADQRWLVHFIADLPWDVEVVEPEWLRAAIVDLGRRLLAQHKDA